jgi:hypothetical protein
MSKPALKNNRVFEISTSAECPDWRSCVPNCRLTCKIRVLEQKTSLPYWAMPAYHRISLDTACNELKEAPSGNRLREVLAQALPDRAILQRALNTILRAQTPRFVKKGKRAYNLAIDLTLIPYHGKPYADEKEIVCSQPKSGITHFHGYATVSIVHDNQRYVLAVRFVEKGESMEKIAAWLLLAWRLFYSTSTLRAVSILLFA